MPFRGRRTIAWVCLISLAVSMALPALRIPGQALTGAELIRLGAQSGVSRLFSDASFTIRVHSALTLLAVASNLVIPIVWFARRQLTTSLAIILSALTIGASVVLTLRVAGRPSAQWLWGAGVWYASVAGLLWARFFPARA